MTFMQQYITNSLPLFSGQDVERKKCHMGIVSTMICVYQNLLVYT